MGCQAWQTLGEPAPKNPVMTQFACLENGVNIHLALHICGFYFREFQRTEIRPECRGLIVLQHFI